MGTTGEMLVVDDDRQMRELVTKVLAREGYSVRPLAHGQDVLQALKEGPAELVISDIRMPAMDGLTLLQEVKRVAKRLLERLHELVDAVDWMRGQETRGAVWTEIRMRLNDLPEQPYPPPLWDAKVDQVWDFVLRRYAGGSAMAAN